MHLHAQLRNEHLFSQWAPRHWLRHIVIIIEGQSNLFVTAIVRKTIVVGFTLIPLKLEILPPLKHDGSHCPEDWFSPSGSREIVHHLPKLDVLSSSVTVGSVGAREVKKALSDLMDVRDEDRKRKWHMIWPLKVCVWNKATQIYRFNSFKLAVICRVLSLAKAESEREHRRCSPRSDRRHGAMLLSKTGRDAEAWFWFRRCGLCECQNSYYNR